MMAQNSELIEYLKERADFYLKILNTDPNSLVPNGRYPIGINPDEMRDVDPKSIPSTYHAKIYEKVIERYTFRFMFGQGGIMMRLNEDEILSNMKMLTKLALTAAGWNDQEEDDVAYCLGLFMRSYSQAHVENSLFDQLELFNEIFKKAFVYYFSSQNETPFF